MLFHEYIIFLNYIEETTINTIHILIAWQGRKTSAVRALRSDRDGGGYVPDVGRWLGRRGDSGNLTDRFDPEVLRLVVELLAVVVVDELYVAVDGELLGLGGRRTEEGGERVSRVMLGHRVHRGLLKL